MKILINEMIPVYETDTGERVVDGRELHDFWKLGEILLIGSRIV